MRFTEARLSIVKSFSNKFERIYSITYLCQWHRWHNRSLGSKFERIYPIIIYVNGIVGIIGLRVTSVVRAFGPCSARFNKKIKLRRSSSVQLRWSGRLRERRLLHLLRRLLLRRRLLHRQRTSTWLKPASSALHRDLSSTTAVPRPQVPRHRSAARLHRTSTSTVPHQSSTSSANCQRVSPCLKDVYRT